MPQPYVKNMKTGRPVIDENIFRHKYRAEQRWDCSALLLFCNHFHFCCFLTPGICPGFAVKLVVRYVVFLTVACEEVAPNCRRDCNYYVIKRTEKQTLPGVAVFVDSGIVRPLFTLVLVFHKDK